MDDGSLLKDNFVCFVVSGFHILKYPFFVSFYQPKKFFIFLEGVFDEIFEHCLSKDFRPYYLCQSFSSQNLACHFLVSSNCHFPHCIIVQRIDSKGFTFKYFSFLNTSLDQRSCPTFDDIKCRTGIPFLNDILPFIIFESDKRRGYLLFLSVRKKLIKCHTFQIFLIFLELFNNYFLDCFSKACLINNPHSHIISSFHCGRSVNIIQKCKLSEAIPSFQRFDQVVID